ncbi:MAG: lysophospholipid acyltransferase family protein [Bacilli bacterium]|nr:lysophospholipid acyltransferase family protein [Bacilli bacterium]MDD4407242.1 lysophospholipid acyltransferase family protein [Bacilli bacterium]
MYNYYLEYLKSYDPEVAVTEQGVKIRKKLHPILKKVLPLANPYKLTIVRKIPVPKDIPIIYTPTHGFKDDLLNTMIIINDHAYTLFGSLDQFYKTIDGSLAHLFGVVIVDRDDPKSRAASLPKMERAMNFGTNGLIFPEGAWNLSDNELVLKLYPGFYKLAKATNAKIVPVATHTVGKKCYGIQDESIDILQYNEQEARIVLRDKLATLKRELIEKYSDYSNLPHKELEKEKVLKEQWEDYKVYLKSQPKYYIEEKEKNYPYVDKNIVTEEEVFSILDNVDITKRNAHILSKIYKKK